MQKLITKSLLATIDIIWLIVIFYISLLIRQNINYTYLNNFEGLSLYDFTFVILTVFILMFYEKIYNFRYDFWQDTLKVIKSFIIGFFITMSILALTKTNLQYSRAFILIYFTIGIILMPILKRYTKKLIFMIPFFKEKVLVIGKDKEQLDTFKDELKENWYLGQLYTTNDYQHTIIIANGYNTKELNNLIDTYMDQHHEIFVVPYINGINFRDSQIMEYSNIRLNTIQIKNKLLIKSNIYIKNIFDKIVSLILLPIFLIVHIFIFIAIKLDSKGSIWFKQKRLGKDGHVFEVYKYRTMYENSDDILTDYLKTNPHEISYYQQYHKYQTDPRITKIGKILRDTSLDELPQLINVLKGDMSLVGPRPYMLNESEKLADKQSFILKVKPGITGLWQVSGRNNLTFQQRNELEIWYIKNWSLWADFVIMLKTIKVVIKKIGAS